MTPADQNFINSVFEAFPSIHTISCEEDSGVKFNGHFLPIRYRHASGIVLAGDVGEETKAWLVEMDFKDENALHLAGLLQAFYREINKHNQQLSTFSISR